ncbi:MULTISPECIES: hypothetical protein [Haloferacaceae]|nr:MULTISPECIES: hypothetical protein [Halorubraceae]
MDESDMSVFARGSYIVGESELSIMSVKTSSSNKPLVKAGIVYFASVLGIGFPIMYTAYVLLVGIFSTLGVGWFVSSAAGITLVAIAFLLGMVVAEKVASQVVKKVF